MSLNLMKRQINSSMKKCKNCSSNVNGFCVQEAVNVPNNGKCVSELEQEICGNCGYFIPSGYSDGVYSESLCYLKNKNVSTNNTCRKFQK